MNLPPCSRAVAFALLACTSLNAHAQIAGLVAQVDASQQQRAVERTTPQLLREGAAPPELYPGESEDLGPQSVVETKRRKNLFEAMADLQFFYTDNALLQRDNPEESMLLVSTAQFALAPTAYPLWNGTTAPRLGFRQQWYDFFQLQSHNPALNTADFNAQTFFADERWTHGDWTLGLGFDYTRLLTTSSYRQFYAEYAPRWEVQRVLSLRPNHALLLSYQGYFHASDAPLAAQPEDSTANRLDSVFLASYNYTPLENVVLQPFYSFRWTHFTAQVSREDYLNSAGVACYYFFTDRISARAFLSYDSKSSSIPLAEYSQFSAGLGANFTFRF